MDLTATKKINMKIHYILFYILVTAVWAKGTVQTILTQDKPPYLYSDSFSIVQSGGGHDTGTINSYPFYSSDGYAMYCFGVQGGNMSFSGTLSGSYTGINDVYIPFSLTEQMGASSSSPMGIAFTSADIQTITEDGVNIYSDQDYGETYSITNPWVGGPSLGNWGEIGSLSMNYHTNIILNAVNTRNFGENLQRTATTVLRFKTGGGARSKLRNVFQFQASACYAIITFNDVTGDELPLWLDSFSKFLNGYLGALISPQNISIGSYGSQNTNGTKYIILPDDDDVVITPQAAGPDYFYEMQNPIKYNSYFEIFAEQANPFDLTIGHVFCRFSTDVPQSGLNYVSTNLTALLGQCEGFYPDHTNHLEGYPGIVQPDNATPYYFTRKFYIGFPGLLNGLVYVNGCQLAPPNYDLGIFDCVNFAVAAGWDAGIDNMSLLDVPGVVPGDVARNLARQYPGPWTDNPTIYYP